MKEKNNLRFNNTGINAFCCCASKSNGREGRKPVSGPLTESKVAAGLSSQVQADWEALPEDVIPIIGYHLNKQDVARLTCVNKAFKKALYSSREIKRPLKEIRAGFKTEVKDLKSGDEIPAYMYDDVQVLTGHRSFIRSVTHLTDGRIVSGSGDNTLRIWGYVKNETGDQS